MARVASAKPSSPHYQKGLEMKVPTIRIIYILETERLASAILMSNLDPTPPVTTHNPTTKKGQEMRVPNPIKINSRYRRSEPDSHVHSQNHRSNTNYP